MKKLDNSKLRFYFSTFLTIIGSVIILWFLSRGIFYEKYINVKNPINLDTASNFGEFIGGVVGTIFSFVGVMLLFETLSFQRRELGLSRNVFNHQQFDNTFFELLKLHKDNVLMFICYDLVDGKEKQGRDFFVYQKNFLHRIFAPKKSINYNRKEVNKIFRDVYSKYEEEFSIYFKTLYQLYSLIDKSDIEEKHKVKYSKILRAQLSSAELFFIRYNAMSIFGGNSIYYINKYNILKHLSHYDLLEFKYWWEKLSSIEKNGLNFFINELNFHFKKGFTGESLSKSLGKYEIYFSFIKDSEFDFSIKIRYTKKLSATIIDGFSNFSNEELENFFKCIFKEFLFGKNFYKFNTLKDIRINRMPATSDIIIINVKNVKEKKIETKYPRLV